MMQRSEPVNFLHGFGALHQQAGAATPETNPSEDYTMDDEVMTEAEAIILAEAADDGIADPDFDL